MQLTKPCPTNRGRLHQQGRRPKGIDAVAILFAVALTVLTACGGSSPIVQDLEVDKDRDITSSNDSRESLSPAAQELDIDIDSDTTWQEVFDALTPSEQACIREELGEQSFDSAIAQPILEFLDSDIVELDASLGVLRCVPDIFVTAISQEMAADPDEMSQDEKSCLRDWIRDIDSATLAAGEDDDSAAIEAGFGILACVPEFLIASIAQDAGVELGPLSDEEKSCLREWARDIDPVALASAEDDDSAAIVVGFGMLACVPELLMASFAEDQGSERDEDYDNSAIDGINAIENATPAAVGETVEGAIEDVSDMDFFVFQAEAGVTYQIDVTPVTMSDPTLELYDSNLESMEYSDDHIGLAPHIQWVARSSDTHYVAVGGYDEGTYTLTIAIAINVEDDHADWPEDATAVAADDPIEGAIGDLLDIDFFTFQSEAGVTYQIDVTPATMSDPLVELYDSNLESMEYSDDHIGLAPRIQWEAPSSGTYYVAVEGFDLGTYTLTIATQ